MKTRYTIQCPCGHRMRAKEKHLGRVCRCTRCRQPVLVSYDAVSPPIKAHARNGARHFGAEEVPVHWQRGDRFMHLYEVVDVLGKGGMGEAHLVRHMGWGCLLAVKTLKGDLLPKEHCQESFERECETWVNLDPHDNVVQCHYVRRLGGIPRLFMEYVPGASLLDYISNGSLYARGQETALQGVLDVAIQMAWGLGYAHTRGLVHQDVKPGNVLVKPDGQTKVGDLGVVRAVGAAVDADTQSQELRLLGTPAYRAPEQDLLGEVTSQCDAWSWAATVLEMLLGKLRWRDQRGLLKAHQAYLGGAVPDAACPGIPRTLADLLTDCLQTSPADRPGDMAYVADAAGAAYAEVAGSPYFRQKPEPAGVSADILNNRAVSALDLGKRQEAHALWDEALQLDPQHVESTYNRHLQQWRTGKITDIELLRRLQGLCEANRDSWIPRYALGCVVLEWGDARSALDMLRSIRESDAERREVVYTVAVARNHEQTSRGLRQRFQAHRGSVCSVHVSDDGHSALSGDEHGSIRLWDLTFGDCKAAFRTESGPVSSLCLVPGRGLVVSGDNDGAVRIWDARTTKCVRTIAAHEGRVHSVCSGREGRAAMSAGRDGVLRLWNVDTGRCVRTLEGHEGAVYSAVLSRCGRYALSGGQDATVRYWDVEQARC
ncbi:MAG: protein kinase, partial [Candidatus Hydrogenedentes bacterium]|nr:protein kinase [Candidatus Hydrogenedentota bacterium]